MGNVIHQRFLIEVLGEDGAGALERAVSREAQLSTLLLPRTILAWADSAVQLDYDGPVPGLEGSAFAVRKTESGSYTGKLNDYEFAGQSLFHVAASVALALGVEHEELDTTVDLQRLGKSIDLLVKSRAVYAETELRKKMLDQAAGYKFSHEHVDPINGAPKMTTVNVHSPQGEHIGYAKFIHQDDKSLTTFGVYVDDAHQRKGIASHMYNMAQKLTGKTVAPSKIQTAEGSALWAGNAAQPQFGKGELPGMTAKPTGAAGPIAADPPSMQSGQPPRPGKQKPKPPVAPVKASVPGMPAVGKLKLSEAQLTSTCPTCAGRQIKTGAFTGCMCWRVLSKSAKLAKLGSDYVITFGPAWDEESIEVFTQAMKGGPR